MLTLPELQRHLYGAADILRGELDTSDYRDYVLGLLFLKRSSDQFDAMRETLIADLREQGKTEQETAHLVDMPHFYLKTGFCYVPNEARWGHIQSNSRLGYLGDLLNKALSALEDTNPPLLDVLRHIDFTRRVGQTAIKDVSLQRLVDHFSRYRLRNEDFNSPDLLGAAYQYLLAEFAGAAGKRGGESYTPPDVVRMMVSIADPENGMRVYDPCSGSGGMLVDAHEHVVQHGDGDALDLSLFGQETNGSAWAISKMNMILHGISNADLANEDTLTKPKHLDDQGNLLHFDRVITNPPFSQNYTRYGMEHPERFHYGWTSETGKRSDLMFAQHVLAVLAPDGLGAIVMPRGVLFRGGMEQRIRRGIIEEDRLEAVIGLAPKLFHGTGIPTCVLVLRGTNPRPAHQRGKVLFIDAEHAYTAGRKRNNLDLANAESIIAAYRNYADVPGFARVVDFGELAANDFNLNVGRYTNGRSAEQQLLADQAEAQAREAMGRQSFDEAIEFLIDSIRQDPDRAERLHPDLNCLSEQPGDSPGRLAWRRSLWLTLAAGSPLELTRPQLPYATVPTARTVDAPAVRTITKSLRKRPLSTRPQEAGADLEVAFINLLKRFFAVAAAEEAEIFKQLRLRRQSSGTQYGHDVQFDCATKANDLVRCHVECKNYTRELKLADISEKIMQTQAYWERKQIDYFLIVTPRAAISNDLDHYIQTMNAQGTLPFQIQVWGPEEGIDEFFAIEPVAYRKVYQTDPPLVDAERVIARWSAKLKPPLRLPPALRDYLTNPRMHSLVGEDHAHFDNLFNECVEVDAVDDAGSRIGTLRDVLSNWIDNPLQRKFLLLGEFGDGKSFACYRLTRSLAHAYTENPAEAHFALRLPLRDLVTAGNPQELLSRRLQALGADMRDWARVKDIGPTLIILDGFDEMSSQLDHATVANNLRLLADCVRHFAESKLLVTSRTHFFENTRMQKRFLEELGQPEVARVAQLPLASRIAYLHAYAEREGLADKFERIRRLYDPVGLAAKPLFLQMIKETLPRLPDDDFDEIVLYEASVRESLERKAEMLLDKGMHTLRKEAIEGLLELLESVAVELLKNGGRPVDLRTFDQSKLDIARVLWRMSEADAGPTQTEDARARLGMRSLLKPFPEDGDSSTWPVAFCHRSMSEYFVAQALVRAVRNGDPLARNLLSSVILRPEIVDFASLLINKADDVDAMRRALATLARSAAKDTQQGYLGGNAITLAYQTGYRPEEPRWAGLDISYADLSAADLTGADFSHTVLRYATLDNADLTNADLTGCDLTGARIEETAPVINVAMGRQDGNVVACYGDGTIREWNLGSSRPAPQKLLDGLSGLRSAAWGPYGDLIVADGPKLSLWTITPDGATRNDAFLIRSGIEHLTFAAGSIYFTQTDENQRIAVSVNREHGILSQGSQLANPGPIAFAPDQTAALTVMGNKVVVVNPGMRQSVPVTVSSADVTALDVRHDQPGLIQLVIGDSSGQVSALRMAFDGDSLAIVTEATLRLHRGPVLSAAFLSPSLVASGGTDRSLYVCQWEDGQFRVLYELKLTLPCSGIKTTGVVGDRERLVLEALRDAAEQRTGSSGI